MTPAERTLEQLQQEVTRALAELRNEIKRGSLPHRLEQYLIESSWLPVRDRKVQRQPAEIVPAYCIVSPDPHILPSVKIDLQKREEHTQRAIGAFRLWFQQAETDNLFIALKPVLREAVLDGQQCQVLPFSPEPGKTIARKALATRAFKQFGFLPSAHVTRSLISYTKQISPFLKVKVDLDFGTWRRSVICSWTLGVVQDVANALASPVSSARLPYWLEEKDIPLLDTEIFQYTVVNIAWASNYVAERVLAAAGQQGR